MLTTLYQSITTPLVVSYWSLRHLVGLGTKYDKTMEKKNGFLKNICLLLLKQWTLADMPLLNWVTRQNLHQLMLSTTSTLPSYAKSEFKDTLWLTKPADFDPEVDPCIIYCHGGGYSMKMIPLQLQWLKNLHESLSTNNPDEYEKMAVLVMDYKTTSEGAVFPQQFNEVTEVYQQLMSAGYKRMMLIGDSAGGNMALNIIQWLEEREMCAQQCVWPEKALLISPWLNLCAENETCELSMENAVYDYVIPRTLHKQGTSYARNTTQAHSNQYINIEQNSVKNHWDRIPVDMLFLAGEHEVLLKQIVNFTQKIKANLVIEPAGLHIGSIAYETYLSDDRAEWETQFGNKTALNFFN